MVITDASIHQALIENGIGFLIAGIVFLVAGIAFGYFFEKERRQVIDEKDRKVRLVMHMLTAFLILTGMCFIFLLGGRWLIYSNSYDVYETTVIDKKENRMKKEGTKNDHIRYYVYFSGTSRAQTFRPVQKKEYDAINIGDRALIVDGIGNSYFKVYYNGVCTYEGTHMVERD